MDNNQIHSEIMRAMGRIEGKIDGILNEAIKVEKRLLLLEEKVSLHQSFIDTWRGKITVIASVISAGIAVSVAVISDYLKK